jgi:photosystem II stability/assembly factor-like uncharacterized protein
MIISEEALKENGEQWELVGPISAGGTAFDVAISPVAEVPRYWAATGSGVYHSADGGKTWQQALAGLTTPLISALAVSPSGALFAGALSGDLFASFDFGSSWESGIIPAELKAPVTVMVASPNFSKDGSAFAATDGGGLVVTRTSGKTWEDSGFGLNDDTVLALATAPDWSEREIMFAATVEGVYVSQNGGRAWRETRLMLEADVVDVLAVSPTFGEDRTVFAGTEGGRIYRSQDGGRNWTPLNTDWGDVPINCLWVDAQYAETHRVVAGAGSRIMLSNDGGESWQAAFELPGVVLSLYGNDKVLLAGLHEAGVWQSTDGGQSWVTLSAEFCARGFARLIARGSTLYALGPQEGLWLSEDKRSWSRCEGLEAHLPLTTVEAGENGELFVASQTSGLLHSSNGSDWAIVCDHQGIQAVLLLPDGGKAWAGTCDGTLLSSTDGGATWQDASSPCKGQEILSLVASPTYAQDKTLFMGTAAQAEAGQQRVALWRSTDEGVTWKQVTTQATPARWIDIAMPFDVEENAGEQAVFASGPYCLRPLRKAKDVWISTRVDSQGANTLGVVVLGEIDKGGQLFAATGTGIYRSVDGGRTWQAFGQGIDARSFVSIVLTRVDGQPCLYALSLGGSLWQRALA